MTWPGRSSAPLRHLETVLAARQGDALKLAAPDARARGVIDQRLRDPRDLRDLGHGDTRPLRDHAQTPPPCSDRAWPADRKAAKPHAVAPDGRRRAAHLSCQPAGHPNRCWQRREPRTPPRAARTQPPRAPAASAAHEYPAPSHQPDRPSHPLHTKTQDPSPPYASAPPHAVRDETPPLSRRKDELGCARDSSRAASLNLTICRI
jgi:hypothetical protein